MMTIPNEDFFKLVEAEINDGQDVRFRIKGTSMQPFLRHLRDEVVLQKCHSADLKPLDIVLFRYHDQYILHRICKIEHDTLIIQGDGIYASQEICKKSDVIGRVTYLIRRGKPLPANNRHYLLLVRLWHRLRFMRRFFIRVCNVYYRISAPHTQNR